MITSVIAEVNRDRKKRHKPFAPGDFMPKKRKPRRVQTWQEQMEIVKLWNKALGGEEIE